MADLLYIKAKLLIQLISALLPFPKEEPAAKNIPLPAPKVLASTSVQDPFFFKVNVNSLFTAPATFQKPITAPNLITEDSAGTGINITEDETGFLTISGNQSGWGDIQVTGQTSLKPAKSGSALTLLGSGGISIATNTTDNKITISASSSDLNVSGWTDGGDYVYLKTEADKVGIGTASPSYKLHVSGTLGAESLTLTSNNLYSSGDLLIDPTGGAVKIGTGTPATLDLAGDDLYVTGDMEVAGTIYGTIDTSTGGLNTGFSSGSVIFQGDSGIEESADTFFWDNANKRLGIGTSTPTTTLEVDGNVTIRNTHSILPDTNLGSDLGSSSYRFNNLYVGNINSNSSASYTGQTTFTYEPTATTIAQTSVLLNPTAPTANSTLLGIAYAGYFRAGLDPEGDLILGYSGNIDSPTTNNPLDIYNHGTTRVGFATTAGDAYFAGKLGIGTTSPTKKFDVLGTARIAGELTIEYSSAGGDPRINSYIYVGGGNISMGGGSTNRYAYLKGLGIATSVNPVFSFHTDLNTGLGSAGDDILSLIAGGTNVLNANSSGNVGIGTTSPISKLHLYDSGVNTTLTLQATGAAGTIRNPIIDFYGNYNNENGSYLAGRIFTATAADGGSGRIIFAPSTSLTNTLTVAQTGGYPLVGIGTTTPDVPLHIQRIAVASGSTTIKDQRLFTMKFPTGAEYAQQADFWLGRHEESTSASRTAMTISLHHGATEPTTADTDVMTLLSSVRVGIGTTKPDNILHVAGSASTVKIDSSIDSVNGTSTIHLYGGNTNAYIKATGSNIGYGRELIFSGDANLRQIVLDMSANEQGTGNILFKTATVPTGAMVITKSGNVGIGTTSPGSLLSLNQTGDFKATPTISFGDGDSGIFQHQDDLIYFSSSGTLAGGFGSQGVFSIGNGFYYATLMSETPSATNPVIVPNNATPDADTGIGWAGADKLSLISGGVESLQINNANSYFASSNVGIGTTSPTSKLYVAGEIKSPTINKVVVVDGVTYAQSCAGINSAIDALGADGGEIYLPQGTYTCAETVYIDNDYTTIRGAGNSTHINASALASGAVIDMYGADYVTIKNLKITGSAGGTAGNAIYTGPVKDDDTYGSDYFVVENVSIINSDDNGIYSRYSDSPIIKNCYIENADSTGIYIYDNGNGAIIEGNTITSSQGGIYFNAANRAIIKGNHLSNQLFGGGVEIGISDSDNTIIIGNTIANTSSIYQGISVTSSTYVTVSDNNITVGWIGIQIDSGSHYSTVSDNFLYGNSGRYGIWVQSNYNTISGNSVNHFVEDNPSYGKGIVIAGTDNVVMGNTLEGNTTALVDGGTNTQFLTPEDGKLAIGLDDTPDASLEIIKQSTFPILYLSSSINADGDLLTVSNDGNIGLGTTSPSSKLAVVGGVAIGTTDSFANAIAPTSGLIVQGNVGIGTTSPSYSLDILNNQNAATGINIKNGTDGASARSVLILDGSQNGHNGIIQFSNPSFNLGSTYGALRADALTLYTNNGAAGGISIVSTHASAPITFALGGYDDTDEKMRITSGGNVGIGTTIPTKGVLNVLGSVAIGSTAYTQVAGAAPSNGLIVEGNVGIGVSDPSTYKLVLGNVSTLANIPGIQFGTTMYFGTTSGYLNRIGLGPTNQTLLYNAGSNSAVTTGHIFSVDYATELMRIMGGPRVGIGTSLAGSTFSVAGSVSIGTTDSFANKAAPTSGLIVEGNVGIGTTIPSSKLHVAGGNIKLGNNYAILGSLSSTGEDREILNYNNGNNLYIGAGDANYVILGNVENRITMDNYSSNRYYMKFNTDSTERMRITNEGYLGIGTTLPGSTLAVVGGVAIGTTDSFANAAIAANNLAIQGDIGIGTTSPTMDLDIVNGVAYSRINAGDANFTASSSRDIKENFVEWDSTGILEKMTAIPVYTYDYIAGPKDRMGLIAEDFFTIFGRGSNKEINYQEVSMAMWLGIKELTKQLSEVQENMGITGATLSSPEVDMTATNSASLNTLTVSGVSTLGDTTVTGDLTAGLISINGLSSSINATGILKLQDMVLGEIDVMGGKIIFDTKGNIDMKQGVILGNSSFRGNIEIPANATDYTYSTTWDKAPESINITPSWNTNVWVDNISTSGFTIHFANPPTEAKKVFWNAIF